MMDAGWEGAIVCILAGAANGSFALPMKGLKTWKWEHCWLAYSMLASSVLPLGAALLFARGVFPVLAGDLRLAVEVGLFGLLWGTGALLFGLSLARLGLAVGNALVSSVLVLAGSLSPLMLGVEIGGRAAARLGAGLVVLVSGIGFCAAASVMRDRSRDTALRSRFSTRRSISGILIAMASGILSAMLNAGFSAGAPLADRTRVESPLPLFAALSIWIPILTGGLLVNAAYTAWLIGRGRSWDRFYALPDSASSWARCAVMSFLWFGAILLYGYGALLMGPGGAVYGWAMTIGVSILTSNFWGGATGEWRGAGRKPAMLMATATLLLVLSLMVLATARGQGS